MRRPDFLPVCACECGCEVCGAGFVGVLVTGNKAENPVKGTAKEGRAGLNEGFSCKDRGATGPRGGN